MRVRPDNKPKITKRKGEYVSDTEESKTTIQETVLELVQLEGGELVLREVKNKDEILVSIDFSEKIKDMLGEDVRHIGESMVQAAMAAVMHRQMNKWHAYVHDEEPNFYS